MNKLNKKQVHPLIELDLHIKIDYIDWSTTYYEKKKQ